MEFPSRMFYENQLKCASEDLNHVEFPMIWRRGRPIMFCHLEGYERSLPVSASEGGLESKSNIEEAEYVVRAILI